MQTLGLKLSLSKIEEENHKFFKETKIKSYHDIPMYAQVALYAIAEHIVRKKLIELSDNLDNTNWFFCGENLCIQSRMSPTHQKDLYLWLTTTDNVILEEDSNDIEKPNPLYLVNIENY